jgi:hypothetical protein
MTFKTSIEELAESISKKARDDKTPFAEAVDALKALTALYAIFLKHKGKSEDDSDGFTMADARATIEDDGHEQAAVRSGAGRRRTTQ